MCGLCAEAQKAAGGEKVCANAIEVDYTKLPEGMRNLTIAELLKMDRTTREEIERSVAAEVAEELFRRLPRNPKDFERLIESGGRLGAEMNWDAVAKNYVLPGMDRAMAGKGGAGERSSVGGGGGIVKEKKEVTGGVFAPPCLFNRRLRGEALGVFGVEMRVGREGELVVDSSWFLVPRCSLAHGGPPVEGGRGEFVRTDVWLDFVKWLCGEGLGRKFFAGGWVIGWRVVRARGFGGSGRGRRVA